MINLVEAHAVFGNIGHIAFAIQISDELPVRLDADIRRDGIDEAVPLFASRHGIALLQIDVGQQFHGAVGGEVSHGLQQLFLGFFQFSGSQCDTCQIDQMSGAYLSIGFRSQRCRFPCVKEQTVSLAQHVESHGDVVECPHNPLLIVALTCFCESLLVVSERERVVAYVVVDVAKHTIEIPFEGRHVQMFGKVFGLLHGNDCFVGLLLLVENNGMVEQCSCQTRFVADSFIILAAEDNE